MSFVASAKSPVVPHVLATAFAWDDGDVDGVWSKWVGPFAFAVWFSLSQLGSEASDFVWQFWSRRVELRGRLRHFGARMGPKHRRVGRKDRCPALATLAGHEVARDFSLHKCPKPMMDAAVCCRALICVSQIGEKPAWTRHKICKAVAYPDKVVLFSPRAARTTRRCGPG